MFCSNRLGSVVQTPSAGQPPPGMVQPAAGRWSRKRPLGNDQQSIEAMEKVNKEKDGERGGGVELFREL